LALTGLRQSEARGLRWSDWNEKDETLMVSRAVWTVHVSGTKNPASHNTIPVLPLLKDLLVNRRTRINPKTQDYIFAGEKRGGPLDFHNLQNRIIRPALKDSGVQWKGFHGFRRGLGTNLLELGVNPVHIARILRHQSISATLTFYAKSREAESRAAMNRLEEKIRSRPTTEGVLFGQNLPSQNGSHEE
jgi:integrase